MESIKREVQAVIARIRYARGLDKGNDLVPLGVSPVVYSGKRKNFNEWGNSLPLDVEWREKI